MSIGKRLSELRNERGWTLEDLHDASGVSIPYLSKLERDKALPRRGILRTVLDELDPDGEAEDVMLERDRAELERLGHDPDGARLLIALEQLDPETRAKVIERYIDEVAELDRESAEREPDISRSREGHEVGAR